MCLYYNIQFVDGHTFSLAWDRLQLLAHQELKALVYVEGTLRMTPSVVALH